jgi:hypothetical protein
MDFSLEPRVGHYYHYNKICHWSCLGAKGASKIQRQVGRIMESHLFKVASSLLHVYLHRESQLSGPFAWIVSFRFVFWLVSNWCFVCRYAWSVSGLGREVHVKMVQTCMRACIYTGLGPSRYLPINKSFKHLM